MSGAASLAIIGDIHLDFNDRDRAYFDASDYDLLLFAGDLSDTFHPRRSLAVAESLAQLAKPALLIPGNHDIANLGQLFAEILGARWLAEFAGLRHVRYHQRLRQALGAVEMGGYSAHPYQIAGQALGVICARPYAMGGSRLNYAPLLRRVYGVRSQKDSVVLLCQQVDALPVEPIIFLAHNGPYGLGASPADIWGCDFDPVQGDFGDRDLADAIAYALQCGKRVLAVVAGHMHLQTHLGPKPFWRRHAEPGPERPWQVVKDGILYLNAARVPRYMLKDGQPVAQHICLTIQGSQVEANEVYVPR
ncbi:MAG: metallophosphoesterase [Anaerolineales bacterium]|nr:metallophosphoesterase [Anaerolineales bacterium]